MTTEDYALEPAATLGPAAAARLRRIYEDGFPPLLRTDFADLPDRDAPGEEVLALVAGGGKPRGLAVVRPLGPTGWWYLRYLVVDARLRSQGLGAIMWDLLTARLRAAGGTLLALDVEDPAEPGTDAEEVALRVRRIRFYQRRGADVLPVRGYVTPAGDPDDPEWVPLLLIAAPLEPDAPAISENQAQAITAAVYRYRWQLGPGHPRVAATTAGMPDGALLASRA